MKASPRPSTVLADRAGFTLIEVLVSVAILTTVAVTVSWTIFQIVRIQRTWRLDVSATKELRSGASIFAGDVLNAASTTLVDGAAATSSVSFMWSDVTNTTTLVTYALTDTEQTGQVELSLLYGLSPKDLVRQVFVNGVSAGEPREVARKTVTALFSRAGNTVTLKLEVLASVTTTVSTTLDTLMRNPR